MTSQLSARGYRYDDQYVAQVCHYMTIGMQVVHEEMQVHGQDEVVLTGPFALLPRDLLDAAVNGVAEARRGVVSPRDHHNRWVDFLKERGWTLGERDYSGGKTHPALVYWDELSPVDRDKARLFLGIVMNMTVDAGT
jgi:hypothetical protein